MADKVETKSASTLSNHFSMGASNNNRRKLLAHNELWQGVQPQENIDSNINYLSKCQFTIKDSLNIFFFIDHNARLIFNYLWRCGWTYSTENEISK